MTAFDRPLFLRSAFNGGQILVIKGELAQLARALAWHARGHRFESGILHKIQPVLYPLLFLRLLHFIVRLPFFQKIKSSLSYF